jgi:hypothetical protein
MTDILGTLESETITEAGKVRNELLTEMDVLHASLTDDIAHLRAAVESPTGHIILGVLVFFAGVLTGHSL